MIAADSDVLIDFLRGREPGRGRVSREIRGGALVTTVVNVFELLAGVRTDSERKKVEALLGALALLPLDEAAARRAAEVRRGLEIEGLPIGMGDSLIAGICLERSATLLTRNHRHFERVEGLSLEPV